jgi:excisionase family DNA binding protein
MKLWPTAKVRPMRFHDLRHSVATLLLRERVDAHRVQRLLRHRDVKTTTATYGHLVVEDLRDAINLLPPAPFAASLLQAPESAPSGVHNSTFGLSENQGFGVERETGFEPATLSLGKRAGPLAPDGSPSQGVPTPRESRSDAFHSVSPDARIRSPFAAPVLQALLTVREIAARLGVSTATVYKLCTRGELRYVRILGSIRVARSDLDAYLGLQLV